MAQRIFLIVIVLFFIGCQTSNKQDAEPIVITSYSELTAHIGQVVTIRGEVSNTKIPEIMSVDVASFDPDLRGQYAEATGLLSSWTVTKEQLEESQRLRGPFANRGPGTFLSLKSIDSNYLAQVREVIPTP